MESNEELSFNKQSIENAFVDPAVDRLSRQSRQIAADLEADVYEDEDSLQQQIDRLNAINIMFIGQMVEARGVLEAEENMGLEGELIVTRDQPLVLSYHGVHLSEDKSQIVYKFCFGRVTDPETETSYLHGPVQTTSIEFPRSGSSDHFEAVYNYEVDGIKSVQDDDVTLTEQIECELSAEDTPKTDIIQGLADIDYSPLQTDRGSGRFKLFGAVAQHMNNGLETDKIMGIEATIQGVIWEYNDQGEAVETFVMDREVVLSSCRLRFEANSINNCVLCLEADSFGRDKPGFGATRVIIPIKGSLILGKELGNTSL